MTYFPKVFALLGIAAVSAQADVQMTFEGLKNQEQVSNFYNGGTGGGRYDEAGARYANGASTGGTNYGISFGGNAVAVVAEDVGGTGRFANNPSGTTVLSFLNTINTNSYMNVSAGFTNGIAFWYSQPFYPISVTVYEGLNATGRVLAVLNLPQSASNCPLDKTKNSVANCFTPVGAAFAGVAHSVDFTAANFSAFDNFTLGSSVTVPYPPPFPPAVTCPILGGIKSFVLEHKIEPTSFTSAFVATFAPEQLAAFSNPNKEIHTHFEYNSKEGVVRAWSIALPLGSPEFTPPGTDFEGLAIAKAVLQIDKVYTTCVPRPSVLLVGPIIDSTAVFGTLAGLPHALSFSFDPSIKNNINNAANVATVDAGTNLIIGPVGSVIIVPKERK